MAQSSSRDSAVPSDHAPAAVTPSEAGAVGRGLIELEIGAIAHGGHCVARHEGRVIFVRHTLPGERVMARLTEAGDKDTFWRADAVEILEASPDRVPSVWPAAGPGGVGGGELAHVRLDAQRAWKHAVIAEQFERLAKLTPQFTVEAAPGDDALRGLGWRTRIQLIADADGHAGMRKHRSHDVVALASMPLASADVVELCQEWAIFNRKWTPGAVIDVVVPARTAAQRSAGADLAADAIVLVDGVPWRAGRLDTRTNARKSVTERVEVAGTTYEFRVGAGGFWQVHREAPGLLANAVLEAAGDIGDATVLDLFSGSGLFTAPLAAATGPVGRVIAIEGDDQAVKSARRVLHGAEHVELFVGDVARTLRDAGHGAIGGADVAVLDPPRAGAGRKVVEQIVALAPSRIVYVACDPAALARDVAYFAESAPAYQLTSLRGLDLFPHTHHVEAIAVLER